MARLFPLKDNQLKAVNPHDVVWLSASAGTGKTQVLSGRVLRLLLQPDVLPSQILCLTFTKAGAAEMANRIHETLAEWVRMEDVILATQLEHIGADSGPKARARARTLFAHVLDCPGGGLRIDTIHAFAQWLLAAFPEEAGLTPGSRAMEDRERALLAREVLSDLLLEAEERADHAQLEAVRLLSLRMGAGEVEAFLLRCAEARSAWEGPGSWTPPLRPHVNRLLGLAADMDEAALAAQCADGAFDTPALHTLAQAFGERGTKGGDEATAAIGDWLLADPEARLSELAALRKKLFTEDKETGEFRLKEPDRKGFEKNAPHALVIAERVASRLSDLLDSQALVRLAGFLAPALTLGRSFALRWAEAKAREGLIDFDDQIRAAAALLNQSDMAEWIRYKLDRRLDHILIDEAQDTNQAQWDIIEALTGDFFAGAGQKDAEKLRTLFVVGDYKQAIFRFQGTSPENFEAARLRVKQRMHEAAANALELLDRTPARELREYPLGQSFRTAAPILRFVDEAIAHIGPGRFGLARAPEPHVGIAGLPGLVTLWSPVGMEGSDEPEEEADEGEEGWLSQPDRQLADRLAQQVKAWLADGFPLMKGGLRRATPGDVMILLRKRKDLASLIVARLFAHGVPVAGIDRLRLGAPLVVKDLLAALRFAAQPLDDLNLAALLVSPLIGWSQEQLLEHGYREPGVRLWDHLRRGREGPVARAVEALLALLARADYEAPHQLLHWLLVGPWAARKRLVARLGPESNDPVDELLNAAQAYAASEPPSLAGFLHWFDAGDGELKREAEGGGDLVRVMTVHGSKGLQAPIVILADAADNPDRGLEAPLVLGEVPLPGLRKEEKLGPLRDAGEAVKAAERQEHWRLLYVAMTRAEEALFVTGSLGPRDKGQPAADSWYARLSELIPAGQWASDPLWGQRAEYGEAPPPAPPAAAKQARQAAFDLLPPWLLRAVGEEARPPRPLAPSSLGEDISADPVSLAGAHRAARRGTLIHKLLERLPDVAPAAREAAARRWLARSAGDFSGAEQADMATAAVAVLAEPGWGELFSPSSLAEVPIAATVGEQAIAGTIDRLLVTPERIVLVDFKSARRPAARLEEIPAAILRQMAAYAAALSVTYPGRLIEAAVLYTHTPALIAIPGDILEAHKPKLKLGE